MLRQGTQHCHPQTYLNHQLEYRCYNLGDSIQREEFVDDFRISAAINILQAVVSADGTHYNRNAVSSSVKGIMNYLQVKCHGMWPGVEMPVQTSFCGATDEEWSAVLTESYRLTNETETTKKSTHSRDPLFCETWIVKVRLIIEQVRQNFKQFRLSGRRNIWIVKAAEASMGKGMKVLHKLEDILECEKGMSGRTVQKYLETPLLAPRKPLLRPHTSTGHIGAVCGATTEDSQLHHFQHHICNNPNPSAGHTAPLRPTPGPQGKYKFDIRVWVLVTSFQPLRAHIYSSVYGRRCGTVFTLDSKTLGERLMHLTNYSIQRKVFSSGAGATGAGSTAGAPKVLSSSGVVGGDAKAPMRPKSAPRLRSNLSAALGSKAKTEAQMEGKPIHQPKLRSGEVCDVLWPSNVAPSEGVALSTSSHTSSGHAEGGTEEGDQGSRTTPTKLRNLCFIHQQHLPPGANVDQVPFDDPQAHELDVDDNDTDRNRDRDGAMQSVNGPHTRNRRSSRSNSRAGSGRGQDIALGSAPDGDSEVVTEDDLLLSKCWPELDAALTHTL